jgi:hypothetical protein
MIALLYDLVIVYGVSNYRAYFYPVEANEDSTKFQYFISYILH